MKALPLVHLPTRTAVIVPVITNSVIKAVHGEPPLRAARLDRAIVHAKLLLDELQSAKLVLVAQQRRDQQQKDAVA